MTEQQLDLIKVDEAAPSNQKKRLLAHLEKFGCVNPLEAWRVLGIYRLSARIFDLREEGHNITRETITVTNKFGEQVSVANYILELNHGTLLS